MKIRHPRSLRARLLVVFVGGTLLTAAIVVSAGLLLADTFSSHMLDSGIQHYAEEISHHVRYDARGVPVGLDESHIEPWHFNSLSEEVTLRILDPQGRVYFSSERGAISHPLAPQDGAFDPSLRTFTFMRGDAAMHGATQPIEHAGRTWLLQFAASDRLVLRMRKSIASPAVGRAVAATCVAFVLLFLVTVHLTLRHALRPLGVASADARRITPRTLDARLDAQAQPVEIRPLVQAFNEALDRLAHGLRTQQEFLASAAHELKTPLALIRAQVELGPRDEHRAHLLDDVDRMARQVQQLLMLAEVSEPQNYRIEAIDPRATLREAFDYMGRVAERRGVHLGLRLDEDLRRWTADRGALFTLLKNLLENAIQHSPDGAVVSLTAGPTRFIVRDQGPGVTEAQLPRLFERFWRGPDRREDGAGLGLSICREIATAHGWRLTARNTGDGLEMRVDIDAPEPADAADAADSGRAAAVPPRGGPGAVVRQALF